MTTNYKILGQALNRLEYITPSNTSTIVSKLKIKNTSYPANIDISVGPSTVYSFSNVYTTEYDFDFYNPSSNLVNDQIISAGLQSDGKVIIGGIFTQADGLNIRGLARINLDGTVDQTFNTPDSNLSYSNPSFRKVVVLSDDKILVSGWETLDAHPTNTSTKIVRLNSDGTIDTTWNNGNTYNFNNYIDNIVVQTDGKVLVSGPFTTVEGNNRKYIARFNADGSLDSSFNSNAPDLNGSISAMQVLSDGKIIIAGLFEYSSKVRTIKLNSDGTFDSSYTFNTPFSQTNAIEELSDGRILMGGNYTYGQINSASVSGNLVLTNSSGNIDNSFNVVFNNTVETIDLLDNIGIFINGLTKLNLSLTETTGAPFYNFVPEGSTMIEYLNNDYYYIGSYNVYRTKQTLISSIKYVSNSSAYLVKNKEMDFDDTIEINGGIALQSGQTLLVDSPDGEDIIIQAYGIEETL